MAICGRWAWWLKWWFSLPATACSAAGARDLLLLSGICAIVRWSLLDSSTELGWLIVAQILHCGSFGRVRQGGVNSDPAFR
ncbi:3-phenylpropionic acid transporter domain protein, partial [Candidatus Erwinia dacicola]